MYPHGKCRRRQVRRMARDIHEGEPQIAVQKAARRLEGSADATWETCNQ